MMANTRRNDKNSKKNAKAGGNLQGYPARYRILKGLFALAGLVILSRVMYLQVYDSRFLQQEGDKRAIRHESIPAHRGVIFDRNGKMLAVSAPVMTIWGDPRVLVDQQEHWPTLARVLDIQTSELATRIRNNSSKEFIYLKRQVTPEEGMTVLNLNIPGVNSYDEHKRYYPMGEVAAHLVGITGIDDKGQEGLELGYDSWLTGQSGTRRTLKDRRGRLAKEAEVIKSAEPGKEIMLSIDLRLQYMAYRELKRAVTELKASSGSLVMLDIETGEVLAMVNQPSYNPNNRSGMQAYRMRNRVMTDLFEPGSTLKPFTVVAGLESGRYNRDTEINTGNGYMRVGRNAVRDLGGYGTIDMETILVRSSNIGVSKIAMDIGADSLVSVLRRVGIGQSIGTGFPGERTGFLPYQDRWSDFDLSTLSFGYGLTVTPLQLAQAYMVLGAGGILRPVSLIKRDVPPQGKRVIDEHIASEVLDMLSAVVRRGSGRRAGIPSYPVAGKTGTVRKVGGSGYYDDRHIGLFAGVVPADNPRLATVVIIDDPSGENYYGSFTAAPVFSKVNAQALRMLGVKPKHNDVLTAKTGGWFRYVLNDAG
ncbi:peptidoglycan D,D-transpeptidase FtsI family protein [Endozoicomonas montiporae]|uniref:Peptidoglycan D,D-transpeptidase FtsI n=1 Tax=Endozoicomonas montiporae CL-33 TaxID=570277 RepID=A0A142BEK2_9GAMM|nr:penicillin-binding transpeptidase domain-containing protein [Endozoicomonas montiporae]AMO57178.1 cell division protein FtsI [Endozoicomonas montiporae CL-33]